MRAKTEYRVNWGNGQVEYVQSKAEGLRSMKGDLYEEYAWLEKRVGADEWERA